jgi:SAM-dependent methyltransferase
LLRLFSNNVERVPTYSKVAYFYDHLMRHVNYPRWANYIIDLFRLAIPENKEALGVSRVLELACGTGKMLVELSRAGYIVYGMDSSYEMVKRAADRLAKASEQVYKPASAQRDTRSYFQISKLADLQTCHVWCGDMTSCAVAMPFDAVICLYDSFNYCLNPQRARQLLECVANALRRGGVFIFDVCTQRNCRKNFRNYYEKDNFNDFSYVRRAYFKPYRKLQINEFIITNEPTGGAKLYERHEQRIYSLDEIREMIDARQWAIAGCFDGMSRRPGTEKSDRVHFVLKRL